MLRVMFAVNGVMLVLSAWVWFVFGRWWNLATACLILVVMVAVARQWRAESGRETHGEASIGRHDRQATV